MAGDKWIQDYDVSDKIGQRIMEMIHERNAMKRTGANPVKLNTQIRQEIKQFAAKISDLRQNLMKSARSLSSREADRRQNLMDQLCTLETRIDQAFRNETSDASKSQLFGGADGRSRDTWDEQDTPALSVGEMRAKQQLMIKEQDEGLGVLSDIVRRQKNMALDIGDEVDSQNDLIDDITDHVDNTDRRLLEGTRAIHTVDRKSSSSCWYWVIIILLLIAIITVACVPGKK
ncbi:syntaxin-8-like [Tubulanus polymorphus]|uniref:syntaxin-8-like n=1 Tax=Tubulanus polymorphus TaxID=672921 RepID=UPI003DA68CD5